MTRRSRAVAVGVDTLLAGAALLIDGAGWTNVSTRQGITVSFPVVLIVTAAVSSAMLFRRRWPLAVLALWWGYGLSPLLFEARVPFAGLTIAVATVAARCRSRVAVVATASAVVPVMINAWSVSQGRSTSYSLGAVAFWLLVLAAAFGVGRVIGLLHERVEMQRRLHAVELSAGIREERLRLARDLHDIVAHSVSAMILQAAGARSLSDQTDIRIRSSLRSIELTGADAMKELHRLLGLLRTPGDDPPPLTAQPGIGDVEQILATTRSCGVQVELRETGVRRPLDPEVSYTAFRMIQECMANVIKHGGVGTRSTVEISWHEDGVDITVRNDEHDAINAEMLSGGYGLQGLTERVEHVGGRFDAGPQEESIFVASASLPLRPRAVAGEG